MSTAPFDIRSEFFRKYFEKGVPYVDYLKTANPTQLDRWQGYEKSVALTADQQRLIKGFSRRMPMLAMSGIWCGDCMRQGPMLHAIARENPNIELRFIDNQENPELRDELRIAGGARVPVVVALSEDFFEVGRSADRTLSHYRAKLQRELGAACDSGLGGADSRELDTELSEWLDFIERAQLMLRVSPFLRSRHND